MEERPLRIFMSYRRRDVRGFAGWLAYCLEPRYGPENVFRDVGDIGAGIDFMNEINRAIKSSDVVLCLIGDEWATMPGPDGQPRLHEPEDPVRVEIRAALERKRQIIPILLEDAAMPSSRLLPDDLVPLARLNALKMRDANWEEDLNRLIDRLETLRLQAASANKMTGQDVVDRFNRGEKAPTWVGRAHGLKGRELRQDVATGGWQRQLYSVQFGGNRPSDNWFRVEAFAEAVISEPDALGQEFDEEHHLGKMSDKSAATFKLLRDRIKTLEGVTEVFLDQYIAYRRARNFAEIVGQKKAVLVFVDGPVDDPQGLGEDVSKIGHWGTGDLRVKVASEDDVDATFSLIQQAHGLQG